MRPNQIGKWLPRSFDSAADVASRLQAPGGPVELPLKPKNVHDENAIAMFSVRGVQVSDLTAERAPWIGKCIQGKGFKIVLHHL